MTQHRRNGIGTSSTVGKRTARGVSFAGLSVLISKGLSFAAQIALGWYLSEGDFALYALAIGVGSLVAILRDGGMPRILVQRGESFAELARPAYRIALMGNIGAAIVLISTCDFWATFYDAPDLKPLIWILAGSMAIGTVASIHKSKLQVDLRFEAVSAVTIASAFVRYTSMVALAWYGAKAYSFVIPVALAAAFESIAYRALDRPLPRTKAPNSFEMYRSLLSTGAWITLGSAATALILQGDYLVIGKLESKKTLGTYFFAFQLTASVSALAGAAITSVFAASMAKVKDDHLRQAKALVRAVRLMAFVTSPLLIGVFVLASPAVHLVWAGKWDDAIIVIQLLALCLLTRLVAPLGLATLEASGRWRTRTAILFVDALGTMIAAGVGSAIGGLPEIAAVVASYRLILGLGQLLLVARIINGSIVSVLHAIFSSLPVPILAGALAIVIAALGPDSQVWELVILASVYVSLLLVQMIAFHRRTLYEIAELFRGNRPV